MQSIVEGCLHVEVPLTSEELLTEISSTLFTDEPNFRAPSVSAGLKTQPYRLLFICLPPESHIDPGDKSTLIKRPVFGEYYRYYVSKPRVRHEIVLFDVATRQTVWVGSSLTKGNARAGSDDLVESLAGETVKQLIKSGLVAEDD